MSNILRRIEEMGNDPKVSIAQLDEYVDAAIAFLKRESTTEIDLVGDIFEIESARQEALIAKYSRTSQP